MLDSIAVDGAWFFSIWRRQYRRWRSWYMRTSDTDALGQLHQYGWRALLSVEALQQSRSNQALCPINDRRRDDQRRA